MLPICLDFSVIMPFRYVMYLRSCNKTGFTTSGSPTIAFQSFQKISAPRCSCSNLSNFVSSSRAMIVCSSMSFTYASPIFWSVWWKMSKNSTFLFYLRLTTSYRTKCPISLAQCFLLPYMLISEITRPISAPIQIDRSDICDGQTASPRLIQA